jgi:hypothetical protein
MINFEEITEDVLRKMLTDIDSFYIDGTEFWVTGIEEDGVLLELDRCVPDYKTYEELVNIIQNHKGYCEFYKSVEVTDIEKYK